VISESAFAELAEGGPAVVRTVAELDAETEPLEAYAALTGRTTDVDPAGHTFLLESAGKVASSDPDGAFRAGDGADRHARYSFVGYDPAAVVTVDGDAESTVDVLDDRYEGIVSPDGGDTVAALRGALPDVSLRNSPKPTANSSKGASSGSSPTTQSTISGSMRSVWTPPTRRCRTPSSS